jgi:hypothetical protein
VRETVGVLSRLHSEESEPVTVAALAKELDLDKSAAWRRARTATDRGYLKNLEDRKGRPARLVPGDPLPDDIEVLPPPERLSGCAVAGVPEGVNKKNIPDAAQGEADKRVPSTPSSNGATAQPQVPLSFDLRPGEWATLEELRIRREAEREGFLL